jgi:hypothetical protein
MAAHADKVGAVRVKHGRIGAAIERREVERPIEHLIRVDRERVGRMFEANRVVVPLVCGFVLTNEASVSPSVTL